MRRNLNSHGMLRSHISDLKTLKQLHSSLIVSTRFEPIYVASKLIPLYSQFHDLESAVALFESVQKPNTFIWNLIIKSYVNLGYFDLAFLSYRRMRKSGTIHDGFTYPIINRAISLQNRVEYAEMIHCVAFNLGLKSDLYFSNTLIEVYLKFGSTHNARKVFDDIPERDLISWTSMISGYVNEKNIINAFNLFSKMRFELKPNSVTVIIMIRACSIIFERVFEGKQLHGYVIKKGFLIDRSVQNSILGMYTLMGVDEETKTFWYEIDKKDIITWNILISLYSSREDTTKVAEIFNGIKNEGVKPSIQTLTLVISSLTKSGDLHKGKMLHCYALKIGSYDNALRTSLLDFYAKCGELDESFILFREVSSKNIVTWSAMMNGLIQNGHFKDAIELYHQMEDSGHDIGVEILVNLVIAFTHLGALQSGKIIHGFLIRNLIFFSGENISLLETSLLNMYIKCGNLSYAKKYFVQINTKDVITWTSMIEGFATHGQGYEVLHLFSQMLEEKMQPNSVTFLSLLSGCSHSGLINEGCKIFHSMKWDYGINPSLDHYTCMVDLLGRFGKIKEALSIIVKMVNFADSRIWGALFAACRVYENKRIGEYAAKRLFELENDNVGYYTLLSNVHADENEWDKVEELREVMKKKDMRKKPGWSCIEEKGRIRGFVSGDRSHEQVEEIYEVLSSLGTQIRNFSNVIDS